MTVGVGSVGGFSGGHPSNRVGQYHEKISGGDKMGVGSGPVTGMILRFLTD